jgi:hypothetical protein
MVALILAACLATYAGPHLVFIILAGTAMLALPFAWRLPRGQGQKVQGGPRFGLPARLDQWSFIQGMALDGLFVMGLSVLAAATLTEGAVLAAGAALTLRYASEVALGPSGGALGERFGALPMLILLSLGSAVGLAIIGLSAWWASGLWVGAIMIVLLRGLLQPLPAPVAAASVPPADRVSALARLATWRDLGAGLGPLLAGAMLPIAPSWLLYGIAALALAAVSLGLSVRVRR